VDRRVVAEFFATATMVAGGCWSVAQGHSALVVSAVFGGLVTLMILIAGPVSGAHINPAVSIALCRDGRLEPHLLGAYMCAQLTGGIVAALLTGGAGPTLPSPSVHVMEAFAVEVVITMLLMASILWVINRTSDMRVIAGVVGLTVGVLAFSTGHLTGASMNPARTVGPNLLHGAWWSLPMYCTSTTLGAWLAVDLKRAMAGAVKRSS